MIKTTEQIVSLAERLSKVAVVITNLVLSLALLGMVYFIFQNVTLR